MNCLPRPLYDLKKDACMNTIQYQRHKRLILYFHSLKTEGRRAFQSNSRTRCLHEGKYWKPKWIHQSSLSTVIWHIYAFSSLLEQHGGALALTKTKKLGEEHRSLKIISFLLKIHKTENLGQQKYDNKLFPVHRKCFCQFNNLSASWYQYIQLSTDAMHVQTRLNLLLRQHIRLPSNLKFLLRNTCVTRKVQGFFLYKPNCSLVCIYYFPDRADCGMLILMKSALKYYR